MIIQSEHKAVLIGLTGGIGSGKSTVSNLFVKSGFTVLNADDIALEIMEGNPEVRDKLYKMFSSLVFNDDRTINRNYLAERVFGITQEHRKALKELNNLVHPHVLDELLERAEELASNGERCIMIEIPLLYEIGLEDAFDYVILVVASEKNRIERVIKRSNISEEQVKARMAEQVIPDQIKGYADFVIENNESLEKLQQSVEFLSQIIPHLPSVVEEENTIQSGTED
ncbi:MAG: dephospho-CoA kinase [Ignavibacteria bacterium]|nr:dephospho-CoA kinase [Ignavibacteria bacterium]